VPRKKKSVEAAVAVPAEVVNTTPAPVEPVATSQVSPPPPMLAVSNAEPPAKTWTPNGPTWETTVTLTRRNDGPKMRCGRNNKFRQMVIQFDELPCEETAQRLADVAWKHREAEGVWTKQLDYGQEASGHRAAQKLFDDVVAIECRIRNLEPVRTLSR
jgi:hypothetical protein